MFTLLAQQETVKPVGDVITDIFSNHDALVHSDVLLDNLRSLSLVWSVVFLTAGLVCMLHGYRFYRTVTVVLAGAIGVFAGYRLGQHIGHPEVLAACLGLLLGIGCFPLMKYAVAGLGGVVGSFIGANAWTSVGALMGNEAAPNTYWVGAIVGLVVFGMLAFILFKLSIVLFTSVSGSTIAVMGGIALLLQIPGLGESVTEIIREPQGQAVIIPLLVLVPAIIGLILQETQEDAHKDGA